MGVGQGFIGAGWGLGNAWNLGGDADRMLTLLMPSAGVALHSRAHALETSQLGDCDGCLCRTYH